MIKFRQKEYSSGTMKLVKAGLKAKDKINTGVFNKFRKVKVSPKSNNQLNRETVWKVRRAKEAAITPINEHIDSGIKFTAGNPVSAVSQAAGKVTLLSGNPTVAAIPVGGIGTGAEQFMKRYSPRYKRVTEKAQDSYSKSALSRKIRKTRLPSLFEISQNLPVL